MGIKIPLSPVMQPTLHLLCNDVVQFSNRTMKLELPLGFEMALAQNEAAMKKFESLTESEKQAVLQKTHSVRSKHEMQQLVSSLDAQSTVE